jgi:hypothetical protein
MAEAIPPANVPPTAAPSPVPTDPPSPAQIEYDRLISYFKLLITVTGSVLGVIVVVAGGLLYTNLRDAREDARQEATRVATAEAKARVADAFNQKNINAMILEAAQEKIGPETDRIIQQQLATRLGPIQEKIVAIGEISDSNMRMRMAFRDGLVDLTRIIKTAKDPDISKFANTTMTSVARDFDTRLQEVVNRFGGQGLSALQNNPQLVTANHRPSDLHDVVQIIDQNSDLQNVAVAFIAFRQLSGENVKMFDLAAVTNWCSRNTPKCEVATPAAPSQAPKQ